MQSRLKLGILGLVTVVVIVAAALTDRRDSADDGDTAVAGTTQAAGSATTVRGGGSATTASPAIKPSADGKELLFVSGNGVVMPVVGKAGAAYRTRTPCGGEVQMTAGRLIGEVAVVIDPGHGASTRVPRPKAA